MILAQIENNNESQPVDVPFLWSSASGCVYLRNVDGEDVIVRPNVCDQKVGKVVTQNVNLAVAWSRRIKSGAKIILEQA